MHVCKFDVYATFKRWVSEKPDDVMIYTQSGNFSYRNIDKMVDYYAHKILEITNGERRRILLHLSHSYKIIVSILAVLKTGCSYVPTQKMASKVEIKKIGGYCGSDVIIVEDDIFPEMRQIRFGNDVEYEEIQLFPHYVYRPNDEIYVLFTSGSTGVPKGCSITYGNLNYIIDNMIRISMCSDESVYCFSTPYTFDVSATEIYSFMYGAKIMICDTSDYKCFKHFPDIINQYRISHLALSPSSLKNMINAYSTEQLEIMNSALKCVMVAGEVFKKEIFNLWEENHWNFRLINLYGPTEATVYATMYELAHGVEIKGSIPIGKCLAGCTYYIDQPDERGIGELILMGDGIAAGYINNFSENETHFFMKEGIRCYRTGDMVSVENGLILFHGRNDNQIQINGIRVELGEIESHILDLPEVHDAVVLYINTVLVSYILLKNKGSLTSDQLKDKLRLKLPRYMIPHVIRFVDNFELNTSNKVDRKKLANQYLRKIKNNQCDLDATSYEITVLKLINSCLQGKSERPLNRDDDFFENGGDSLDTFLLLTKLEDVFQIEISSDTIYLLKTGAKIAEYIREKKDTHRSNFPKKSSTTINWGSLVSLTSQIKSYLYYDCKKLKKTYQPIHLQYGYYYNKYDLTVTFKYEIGNEYSLKDIQNALKSLVVNNPILYSKISDNGSDLMIHEFDYDTNNVFPYIECCDTDDQFLSYIEENYSKELFYARYCRGLLSVFIIVLNAGKYYVIGLLDHTISDASNVSLIKIKLSDYLNGKEPDQTYDYSYFCELVRNKNCDIKTFLKSNYYRLLEQCTFHDKQLVRNIKDQLICINFNNLENMGNHDISMFLSFEFAKKVNNYLNNPFLAIRTTVNMRKFREGTFANTLGDIHSSIFYIYKKGMSFGDFLSFNQFVNDFYYENCLFLGHLKRFGDGEKTHRDQLKKCMNECKLLSVDYLGVYEDCKYAEFVKEIGEIQNAMYSEEENIYVTAVMNNNVVYAYLNKDL